MNRLVQNVDNLIQDARPIVEIITSAPYDAAQPTEFYISRDDGTTAWVFRGRLAESERVQEQQLLALFEQRVCSTREVRARNRDLVREKGEMQAEKERLDERFTALAMDNERLKAESERVSLEKI